MDHGPAPPPPPPTVADTPGGERLLSLDVFRGLIMLLLVGEGALIYESLDHLDVPALEPIAAQFQHHPWNGLRFWDLIQPGFMFIVGVAMVYSMRKRAARGDSWGKRFGHIAVRCVILFLLGTGLHCYYSGELVFELWNVLTQLSVTVMITFLVLDLPLLAQLLISLALLLAADLAYRFIHVPPYDGTFEPGRNFGSWMDMVLMGRLSDGHWVAINAVPTAAHTIWGAMAGRVLIGQRAAMQKITLLAAFGLAGLVAGYGLDLAGVTPIVKRICTGSFVIVSGGWCLLALAFFYWVLDVSRWRTGAWIVTVVGMNSIFIYMVSELLAYRWVNPTVGIFTGGVLGPAGMAEPAVEMVTALVAWAMLWGLCYWMYRKRIFIKI